MFDLKLIGWNEFFETQFNKTKDQGFSYGRISSENKSNYTLFTGYGEIAGEASGKLLYSDTLPKVGDWVVISLHNDNTLAIIHDVLPRKTQFSRKAAGKKITEQIIAANIDKVFIMQSLDDNFNINRLERYMIAVYESKAVPVIILSKADLCNTVQAKVDSIKAISDDISIFVISSLNHTGIIELKAGITPGETVVVVGSSGVGKSTMINLLLGSEQLKTNAVRESDSRGKHTTTRREMILLPSGGILIDTPGMREFALWNADTGFQKTFTEIDHYAAQCFFADCTHIHEKNCAVLEALNNKLIPDDLYKNCLKLYKELKYLETKHDIFAKLEEKKKWKAINKEVKRYFKRNDV